MNKPISLRNWNMGGISESRILAERDEAMFKMLGVNVHGKVGLLKNSRRLVNTGSTVIDNFVLSQVACSNGINYAFSGGSGKIWEWDGDEWVLKYTASSETGDSNILGAFEYDGFIYFATQNYLYRMPIDYADQTWSSYVQLVGHLNLDAVVGDAGHLGGTGQLYTLLTSVNETAGNYIEYVPKARTLSGFGIYIDTVPSTSLTIALHDQSDNLVASVTVSNANLTTGFNEIYLSSPFTYIKGSTYHVHMYQTGTGGKLGVSVADELTDAYLEVYSESNASYHPMTVVNDVLFIGDGRYIHQVENVLVLNALDIPAQQVITSLDGMGIELLVTTEVSSLIHSGMIFRWNTWSESWTIEDEIPERSVRAFIPVDNFVYVVAGNMLNVYFYNGEQLQLFRRIGGEFNEQDSMIVHPNAVASLNGIPLIGVSSGSNNPVEAGVYSMGTMNPRLYPRVFVTDYILSCGMENTEIGSISVLGDQVFISWKHTEGEVVTYGIDMFDSYNLYEEATVQTRVIYQDRNSDSTYTNMMINYMSIQDATDNVVFTSSTDVVTLTGHGLHNGDRVKFTGELLPEEITADQKYYVINATANTYQISDEEDGDPITWASDGSGEMKQVEMVRAYYRTNYDGEWTEIELTHDPDKKQFITDSFGVSAYAFELKFILKPRGMYSPVIDEITLESN